MPNDQIQDITIPVAPTELRSKAGFAKTHGRRSVMIFLDEQSEDTTPQPTLEQPVQPS